MCLKSLSCEKHLKGEARLFTLMTSGQPTNQTDLSKGKSNGLFDRINCSIITLHWNGLLPIIQQFHQLTWVSVGRLLMIPFSLENVYARVHWMQSHRELDIIHHKIMTLLYASILGTSVHWINDLTLHKFTQILRFTLKIGLRVPSLEKVQFDRIKDLYRQKKKQRDWSKWCCDPGKTNGAF